MVGNDGTQIVPRSKRNHTDTRQWQRRLIRKMSRDLVRSGKITKTPCLLCGSKEELTIHHLEPMRPQNFVFLCEPCHALAHKPVYRTIRVKVVSGQFMVRPAAVLPRQAVLRG